MPGKEGRHREQMYISSYVTELMDGNAGTEVLFGDSQEPVA